MLKKILIAALVAAPMFLSAQTAKFGFVEPNDVLNLMPEVATAQQQLKTKQDAYTKQAQQLENEANKIYTQIDSLQKAKAPEAVIQLKTQEFSDVQTRYQNFQQTASKDLQTAQQQLFEPIYKKLQDAIKAVGTAGGYTGIFTESALLYQGNSLENVTEKVKSQLGIKPGATPAAAPAASK